jgi:hypothetical protein
MEQIHFSQFVLDHWNAASHSLVRADSQSRPRPQTLTNWLYGELPEEDWRSLSSSN